MKQLRIFLLLQHTLRESQSTTTYAHGTERTLKETYEA